MNENIIAHAITIEPNALVEGVNFGALDVTGAPMSHSVLAPLQTLVGGYIQPVYLSDDLARLGLIGWVDEDGIAHGRERNYPASVLTGLDIFGTLVIAPDTSRSESEPPVEVTADQVEAVTKRLLANLGL